MKILASDMDNVERDDADAHYSLEDVPYVQFFDNAVALHGTFWHRDFGHVKSHGCVNLAPLDARWLFDFTGPRLPAGWVAALPGAPAGRPGHGRSRAVKQDRADSRLTVSAREADMERRLAKVT